jgi:hypothetical protein
MGPVPNVANASQSQGQRIAALRCYGPGLVKIAGDGGDNRAKIALIFDFGLNNLRNRAKAQMSIWALG